MKINKRGKILPIKLETGKEKLKIILNGCHNCDIYYFVTLPINEAALIRRNGKRILQNSIRANFVKKTNLFCRKQVSKIF